MKFKRLVVILDGDCSEFTLAGTPIENSVNVYYNGIAQTPEQDWRRDGRKIFLTDPFHGGTVQITYCVQ